MTKPDEDEQLPLLDWSLMQQVVDTNLEWRKAFETSWETMFGPTMILQETPVQVPLPQSSTLSISETIFGKLATMADDILDDEPIDYSFLLPDMRKTRIPFPTDREIADFLATENAAGTSVPGHTDLMVTPESLDKWLEDNPLPVDDKTVESPTPVTDSEKRTAEVVSDIVSGKITKPDLPTIRQAIDKAEGPKTGRDAADHAIGHSISRNRKE